MQGEVYIVVKVMILTASIILVSLVSVFTWYLKLYDKSSDILICRLHSTVCACFGLYLRDN